MKTIGIITANYKRAQFAELTQNRSLASLPFGGRYRLIDFVLSNMVNSGISKVGIINPYNSASLIDHIGAGKQWGLDRKHDGLFMVPGAVFGMHEEGSKFLLKDIIANYALVERTNNCDYVLISSGTDVYNFDYNELINAHKEAGNDITFMYRHVDNAEEHWGYALDLEDGKVQKMYSDAEGEADFAIDCFVINKTSLDNFVNWFAHLEYMDMIEIISLNLDKFKVGGFEFKGYIGSINSMKDYLKASKDLFDYDIRNEIFNPDRVICTKAQDDAPVLYKPGSNVRNSIIATGCRIEGTVEESIIFRSTNIKKDALVKNSVVMLYSEVGEGAVLENVICDKFVKISAGAKIIGSPEKPIVITKGTHI